MKSSPKIINFETEIRISIFEPIHWQNLPSNFEAKKDEAVDLFFQPDIESFHLVLLKINLLIV